MHLRPKSIPLIRRQGDLGNGIRRSIQLTAGEVPAGACGAKATLNERYEPVTTTRSCYTASYLMVESTTAASREWASAAQQTSSTIVCADGTSKAGPVIGTV
jgi:hypothetical protein